MLTASPESVAPAIARTHRPRDEERNDQLGQTNRSACGSAPPRDKNATTHAAVITYM